MSNPTPTLHVRIISPKQLILETEAKSVSSKNSQGNFDILPQHANFITLVENTPIIVRPLNGKPLVFNFPFAIVMATENKVSVYTYVSTEGRKESSAYIQPVTTRT